MAASPPSPPRAAAEEVTATVREIASQTNEAANIAGVSEAAQSSTEAAATAEQSAAELNRLSEELLAVVNRFRFSDSAAAAPVPSTAILPDGPAPESMPIITGRARQTAARS